MDERTALNELHFRAAPELVITKYMFFALTCVTVWLYTECSIQVIKYRVSKKMNDSEIR